MPTDPTPEKLSSPPYLAFKSLQNFVTGVRTAGIPSRIDRSVLGGLSGATQSGLLQTLRYLRLIGEDGKPTEDLVRWVSSPDSEKETLREILQKSYGFVLKAELDLNTATEGQLQELFRKEGLSGDTVRKAMSFFVNMADAAGFVLSPHIKGVKVKLSTGQGTAGPRTKRKKAAPSGLGDESNGEAGGDVAPAGSKKHVLPLNREGTRTITVIAPLDLDKREIERIKKWLEVTLLIEDWEDET